jgi:hypothetical protein
MAKKKENKTPNSITVDGTEYDLDKLSNAAKDQIGNLSFIDNQLQQKQNEFAISDTARLAYTHALKKELESNN